MPGRAWSAQRSKEGKGTEYDLVMEAQKKLEELEKKERAAKRAYLKAKREAAKKGGRTRSKRSSKHGTRRR
jgi:hypothetical protein